MGTLAALIGYQTKTATISDAAKPITHTDFGFTTAELAAADHAMVTAFTQPIVLTFDGATPTALLGVYLDTKGTVSVAGNANVKALQFFRAGGSDATASITLLKFG